MTAFSSLALGETVATDCLAASSMLTSLGRMDWAFWYMYFGWLEGTEPEKINLVGLTLDSKALSFAV